MKATKTYEKTCCEIRDYAYTIWPMIANECNNGQPVYRNVCTSELIEGRYCGEYATKLRKLVRGANWAYDLAIDVQLDKLLPNLIWATQNLLNNETVSGKPDDFIEDCKKLPYKEKIRQCDVMLDFLDAWCARAAVMGYLHKSPVAVLYYNPFQANEYRHSAS